MPPPLRLSYFLGRADVSLTWLPTQTYRGIDRLPFVSGVRQSPRPSSNSGAASTSQRLPEGLGDRATMQRLRVAACEHLHHRAEVTPRLLGLAPVIIDSR